jgi:hypothetical protein
MTLPALPLALGKPITGISMLLHGQKCNAVAC